MRPDCKSARTKKIAFQMLILVAAGLQIRPNKENRISNAYTRCGRILGQAKRHPIGVPSDKSVRTKITNPPEQNLPPVTLSGYRAANPSEQNGSRSLPLTATGLPWITLP